MVGFNPGWIAASWPIALFIGGMLWMGGRHKGSFESLADDQEELFASLRLTEERSRLVADRLDRLDLRLTAAETNVSHQSRTLDRIEAKLDRLIEDRRPIIEARS